MQTAFRSAPVTAVRRVEGVRLARALVLHQPEQVGAGGGQGTADTRFGPISPPRSGDVGGSLGRAESLGVRARDPIIELMFDILACMEATQATEPPEQAHADEGRPTLRRLSSAARRARLEELRAELGSGRFATTIPTEPALVPLFPGPGLRKGAVYSVADGTPASTSLLLAMLAGPSRAGLWCGVVGLPGLGAEAAAGYGIDLRRLALVPSAGSRWLEATAALADVLDVVVVRPETPVRDAPARRLAARLRERGAVLLVVSGGERGRWGEPSDWPGRELRFAVTASRWTGLGSGHGHLTARRVTVEAVGRGAPRGRRVDLWLPDSEGVVRPADPERLEHPASDVVRPVGSQGVMRPVAEGTLRATRRRSPRGARERSGSRAAGEVHLRSLGPTEVTVGVGGSGAPGPGGPSLPEPRVG